jgi:hypothetical protein
LPIAAFTRVFCQSPGLFRLISGSLCQHVGVFCQPTVLLGSLTEVVGLRGHLLFLLALLLRRNVIVIHKIHLPAAYQLRRARDVLKGTLGRSSVSGERHTMRTLPSWTQSRARTCALLNRPDARKRTKVALRSINESEHVALGVVLCVVATGATITVRADAGSVGVLKAALARHSS